MPASRKHTHWTSDEVELLRWLWAEMSITRIAKKLGRTHIAIVRKAVGLSLGGVRRGTKTMAQISRETGYEAAVIKKVTENLGLKLRRAFRGDHGGKPRDYAIRSDHEAKIIAYLREHGKGNIFSHEGVRSPRGMWGVGLKPPVCTGCQKTDKPHYAKGKCKHCYDIAWKEARRIPDLGSVVLHEDPSPLLSQA